MIFSQTTNVETSPQVLFVDDSRTARKVARKYLKDRYRIHTSEDAEEAWGILRTRTSIKIVFTDINMKGMNGIDLLKSIRESENPRIAELPVIMITGAADSEASMRKVFEMGATDFIAKPFKQMDLISRAYSYIKLSERVNSLQQQLGIDKLSGLHNESSMKQHAAKFLAFSHRYGTPLSIAHMDIRRFDNIVEVYGSKVASQIIQSVSRKLQETIRDGDLAARLDASRFVILLPACTCKKAQISIDRIRSQVENIRFKVNGVELRIRMIAGISSTDVNVPNAGLDHIQAQAKQSLVIALNDSSQDIVLFDDSGEEDTPTWNSTKNSLMNAFKHILNENYSLVTGEQQKGIENAMREFMQQHDKRRAAG